jgi:molecular chaperone GrpE
MTEYDVELEDQEEADDAGRAEVEALRAEIAASKEQALRLAAEVENTRRRAEREANEARAFAISRFAKDLMGVADNLGRALEHAPRDSEDPAVRNLVVGLELTQKALMDAFERNGLKRISPAAGERFDPHQHQAVMEQTSAEFAPGRVLQILQDGYELFGRNLRAAMAIVSARDSTGRPGGEGAQDTEDKPAAPGVTD